MSDGSLSQDEIDALLSGSGGMDFDSPSKASAGNVDISGLQSAINETVDSQATNLSSLTGASVSIDPPTVQVTDKESFLSMLSDEIVVVAMAYTEGVACEHGYVISTDGALAIAGAMMGLDGVELDESALSALQEAMSNLSGPLTTAIGDKADATIMTATPEGQQSPKAMIHLPAGQFVAATYTVNMDGSTIQLYEYFGMPAAERLAPPQPPANGAPAGGQKAQPQQQMGQQQMQQQMGQQQAMGQQQMGYQQPMQQGGLNVQSVQFPSLQQGPAQQEQGNISLLMDVYMEMTVELGRTRKLIREILGMGEGTIIELDKLAGEPVDILVNHKLIAKGEVVVIDENFGVRVTEIVSPLERMNNMT